MMSTLADDCPGVVAHSSGNHAQAVALAARELGLRAIIVMPDNAPPFKRERTEAYGADVVIVGPDSEERKQKADELASELGLVLVPPYDHPLIAAGQGTAALEVIEALDKPLDQWFCPISGGGLFAGCGTILTDRWPQTALIGVEPEAGNDTQLSIAAGTRVAVPPPDTIADGLRVRKPGEFTFSVNRQLAATVTTVTDDEMIAAMSFALRHLRLALEPSGAASLAAALREGRGHVGVLLSGGNFDPVHLRMAAERL